MAHPPVSRSGNAPPETQLQKVIEKQRILIQNLQKENAILAAERDGLRDRVVYLEQQLARKDRILVDDSAEGPTPPPRSLWRAARASESSDGDRSASPVTLPPQSPTSPQAIIEKDAQTFAKYQSAVRYKSASPPPIIMPTASKSSSIVDARRRRPTSPQQQQPPFLKESKRSSTAPPSAFLADSNVSVKVVGSTIKRNDRGREVIAFVISVRKAHGEELWRVEKLYSDFLALDAKIKVRGEKVGKLHDKQIFSSSRAPSKIDQRKIVLEQYLQHVIASPNVNLDEVCEFLTTDILEQEEQKKSKNKAGYLIKRGKNFGGWKIRYFVINGDVLEYFESKGGAYLGAIKLTNAQLGRQAAPANPEIAESSYRHAFLILEQKRLGSSGTIKHILCANSDEERDAWIDALLENIRLEDIDKKNTGNNSSSKKAKKVSKIDIRPVAAAPIKTIMAKTGQGVNMDKLANVPDMQIPTHSTEVTSPHHQQQQQPTNNGPSPSVSSGSGDSAAEARAIAQAPPPLPPTHQQQQQQQQQQPIVRSSFEQQYASRTLTPAHPMSRRNSTSNLGNTIHEEEAAYDPKSRANMLSPTPGAIRSSDDLLDITAAEKKSKQKANRMTIWGKKMFSGTSEPVSKGSEIISSVPSGFRNFLSRTSNDSGSERPSADKGGRQVFGVPLEEAVQNSRIKEGYELPAIVHRCIEYLDAKKAVMEEGLYRLSGSNTEILALKQKFNQEGDVNLLGSGEEYDVHAIAGLLKLWLRELPSNVLTEQMKPEFLHVIDLLDHKDRVNELGKLVSQLPLANYTLLRALTTHLICVVQHADINKMNVWNINMVFSLTLDIPATIIRLFMSEFEYIFWATEDGDVAPRFMEDSNQDENQQESGEDDKLDKKEKEEEQEKTPPAEEDKSKQQDVPSTPVPGKIARNPTLRRLKEEGGRSNRNSVHYMEGAPHVLVDMEKHPDGPPMLDDGEEEADDLELLMAEEANEEEKSSSLQVPVASPPPRRPSA